jgi:hypothetical protein
LLLTDTGCLPALIERVKKSRRISGYKRIPRTCKQDIEAAE